jgi:putative DNA primase/helicase
LQVTRRITIELPASLRFHPGVKVPGQSLWLPALVAAVSAEDRKPLAVQITWLDPETGDKSKHPSLPSARRTYGALDDGAVRLGAAGDTLALAEGVETALSVSELFNVTCWAVLGAQRSKRAHVPISITRLHIFADADEAGYALAERAAHHHARHDDLAVRLHVPDEGGDYNDELRRRRGHG